MKFADIPLSQIVTGSNLRKLDHDEEMNDLSASVKEHGVLQPIVVKRVAGRYKIIVGHRRLHALKLAGEPTAPCLIRDDIEPNELAFIRLIENTHRKDLTPTEIRDAINEIRERIPGIKNKRIAVMVGRSEAWVSTKLQDAGTIDAMESDGVDREVIRNLSSPELRNIRHGKHDDIRILNAKPPRKYEHGSGPVETIRVRAVSATSAFIQTDTAETLQRVLSHIQELKLTEVAS